MGANDAVDYCGKCRRQWPYGTNTCGYCGSKLVVWNDRYESEQQAIKKWQERNGR
jgi:rRNA maturation endonuclease Nob1